VDRSTLVADPLPTHTLVIERHQTLVYRHFYTDHIISQGGYGHTLNS
jgi:hypothetical protein